MTVIHQRTNPFTTLLRNESSRLRALSLQEGDGSTVSVVATEINIGLPNWTDHYEKQQLPRRPRGGYKRVVGESICTKKEEVGEERGRKHTTKETNPTNK